MKNLNLFVIAQCSFNAKFVPIPVKKIASFNAENSSLHYANLNFSELPLSVTGNVQNKQFACIIEVLFRRKHTHLVLSSCFLEN